MLLAALALAHVANAYDPPRTAEPRNERVVTATVTIIAAEEVAPLRDTVEDWKSARRPVARQRRVRGGMPLVEFF